jgi:hypothetical protein
LSFATYMIVMLSQNFASTILRKEEKIMVVALRDDTR